MDPGLPLAALLTALSGLATGLGAVLAAVGGVMVFISLDQPIPNARRYGAGHASVYGLPGGMATMALVQALGG